MAKKGLITTDTRMRVEFYDVDTMRVMWHGNYVKLMEAGRCTLLNKVGYNYTEMEKDGYIFPITSIKVKYIRSLKFNETATIRSSLIEYENLLKINYEIFNEAGELCTKAESAQMAVRISDMESQFVCPKGLTDRVEKILKEQENY